MLVQRLYKVYCMPYIIINNKPIQTEYNGYKYELPNNTYKWIPDNWYDSKATQSERDLIDQYVRMIYDSVKYITDKKKRIDLIIELIASLIWARFSPPP